MWLALLSLSLVGVVGYNHYEDHGSLQGALTMSREAIKDRNVQTIGYVETMPDGKQKAPDANFRTLGHYDPKRNLTQDTNFRTIVQGNVSLGLVYK